MYLNIVIGLQLLEHLLSVTIHTECACCRQPLVIELDSDLKSNLPQQYANPLVFVPLVDFNALQDPSIIDAF